MKRDNLKFELMKLNWSTSKIEEIMKIWDYVEKKYKGEWYDCGSLSCRCSECGCKSQKPTLYCPNCGEKMEKGDTNEM